MSCAPHIRRTLVVKNLRDGGVLASFTQDACHKCGYIRRAELVGSASDVRGDFSRYVNHGVWVYHHDRRTVTADEWGFLPALLMYMSTYSFRFELDHEHLMGQCDDRQILDKGEE